MLNITGVKNILNRKFRGANIDDVQGITDFSLFYEAASKVTAEIDPQETIRRQSVNLFQDILDYDAPDGLKAKKIIDIRKRKNRSREDDFSQVYIEDLDRDRRDRDFTVEFDNGDKIVRVVRTINGSIELASNTELGGWVGAGGATNVEEHDDTIRFDVGVTGGYIENSSLDAVDLTDHENIGSLFIEELDLPDASILTSVDLRVGNDSSNYFHRIVTEPHRGDFQDGLNVVRFDLDGITEVGTVDITNIDYARVTLVTTSSDTDIQVGKISSKLPSPHDFIYYSAALFRGSDGTWKEVPTDVNDVVQLEGDAFTIFLDECCMLIADQLTKPDDANKYFEKLYGKGEDVGSYAKYKAAKPDEPIVTQTRHRNFGYIKK